MKAASAPLFAIHNEPGPRETEISVRMVLGTPAASASGTWRPIHSSGPDLSPRRTRPMEGRGLRGLGVD
ncbi:hypothetical protein [Methylobacterium sp. Leaf85]|uniref:hypothetical protein n=1 Tax=Methylobacterium sp. Leaf85 TaxID=1736241 RepID=UPI0006F20866|nr:hypothetical protein [Methylobacterium sp. Leaf85]KQO53124.1 hypothetical protein ASF08_19560 [Methylobacterium sp. Leaf85]